MALFNTLKLFLSRSWFLRAESDHQDRLREGNPAWGEFDEADFGIRISKKRQGLLASLFLVSAVVVLGYLTSDFSNSYFPLSQTCTRLVQLSSVIIIAWAVLSRLGYETPTFKGQTLLEITSEFAFKLMYLFGLYLGTIALFLKAGG